MRKIETKNFIVEIEFYQDPQEYFDRMEVGDTVYDALQEGQASIKWLKSRVTIKGHLEPIGQASIRNCIQPSEYDERLGIEVFRRDRSNTRMVVREAISDARKTLSEIDLANKDFALRKG